MSFYERMKRKIERDATETKLLRGQALSGTEQRMVGETTALISEILDEEARSLGMVSAVERSESGEWFIAVGDDFHFTKKPSYHVQCRMQPSICTKGCADYIATKEDFLDFMRNHLSHPDHEPSQQF